MFNFLDEYYLVIKAIHLLSIIAWMAGLLYLPRLFVYHHRFSIGTEGYKTFIIMENRLLKIIILPAMISVFLTGFALVLIVQPLASGWFHTKLFFVLLLCIYHGLLSKWAKLFAKNTPPYSEKAFRYINEIPFLLLVGVVFLAILKPN